jgi:hypothetical protein
VFLRFKLFIPLALLTFTSVFSVFAQETTDKKEEKKTEMPAANAKDAAKNFTVEQIVESTILIYAFPGGRETLNQIRKTTIERGRTTVTRADGATEGAAYQKWILRGASLDKERIRLDQDFPSAKYSLVYNTDKIFGIFKDSVFTPSVDASKGFENQIIHGPEALLRFKENESKIELSGRDKVMGVDLYLIDVTDKLNRKTRFYISAKSYRIMMLGYEEDGVKFRRKFYDYNYAQGTLVAFRTVLWAGEKIVEETDIQTVTFGQRVDADLFISAG